MSKVHLHSTLFFTNRIFLHTVFMGIAARCLHGAGVCVLPLPANNHRPLALRHKPLAAVSLLLILSKVLAFMVLALTPASAQLATITSDRIVQLTNAERAKTGLPPLTINPLLTTAAVQKGTNMLEQDYFAHISPTGVTPWFWINKAGYTYQAAGENLAIDFFEAEDVVTAWMNSPSHRDNILQPDYMETGVGVVTGEFQGGTSIVVIHMFGVPAVAAARSEEPAVELKSSPAPTPPLPTPEPAAPRTPRIALHSPQSTVQTTLPLLIEADNGSVVQFLVNGEEKGQATAAADEPFVYQLSVTSLPDGPLHVTAYSSRSGQKSPVTAPLMVTKDSVGPAFDSTGVAFFLSPMTDRPQVLVQPPATDVAAFELVAAEQTFSVSPPMSFVMPIVAGEISAAVIDGTGNRTTAVLTSLAPSFADTGDLHETVAPRYLTQLTRRLAVGIFITLAVLLSLAIVIRIRIQHSPLITHTAVVLLLACLFFFL